MKKTFLLIAALLVVAILIAVCVIAFSGGDKGEFIVCLDAGHGDHDVGALSLDETRQEKDDNLAMALAVRDILEQQGIKVVMTRDDDTFLSLKERCDIANDADATLFVSLHRNSGGGSGVEVWISSDEPRTDKKLATKILDGLTDVGVTSDRGVKSGTAADPSSDYGVNKSTDMPSCIVELGFIDSDADNAFLDENFDAYANAIANAIMEMK